MNELAEVPSKWQPLVACSSTLFLKESSGFMSQEALTHASSQYLILFIHCYASVSFRSFLTILTFLYSICFGVACGFLFYWFMISVLVYCLNSIKLSQNI